MSIRLQPTPTGDLEAEPAGHNYRLRLGQFRSAVEAGIIPEGDGVELRDGFLCLKADPRYAHYRLDPAQYREMARLGILTTDDRIELLEGWLVAKMTKKPRHEIAKGPAQDLLTAMSPAGWFVTVERPTEAVDSEPEPDLVIVKVSRRDYRGGPPQSSNVALVVEVADTSLRRDRSTKKRIYLRSGYVVYWIVNLVDRRVEVYTDPSGPTDEPDYLDRRDYGPDERIPLVLEGHEIGRIAVVDLLP